MVRVTPSILAGVAALGLAGQAWSQDAAQAGSKQAGSKQASSKQTGAQAKPVEHRPSRAVPAERALLTLEIPRPMRIAELAPKLFQVGVFDLDKWKRFVATIEDSTLPAAKLAAKRRTIADFVSAFDRGLTAAVLRGDPELEKKFLHQRFGLQAWTVLLGSASKAKRLRQHPDFVRAIFERTDRKLIVEERLLLDSPVPVQFVHTREWPVDWKAEAAVDDTMRWMNDGALFYAQKGASAAYVFGGWYEQTMMPRVAVPLTGEILGLTSRGTRKMLPVVKADEELLARVKYNPQSLLTDQDNETSRIIAEVGGALVIDKIDGVLALRTPKNGKGEPQVVERIDLNLLDGKSGLFGVLRPEIGGMHAVARHLPKDTILAVHVRLHGKMLSTIVRAFINQIGFFFNDDTADSLFGYLRAILGKAAQKSPVDLEGCDEVVLAVVPGAAGSPVPEVVVLSPAAKDSVPVKNCFAAVAAACSEFGEVDKDAVLAKVKRLGKSPVSYLKLNEVVDAPRGVLEFWGGGFVSAARVGTEWFAFGANPRTIKRIAELGKEDSILANASLLDELPRSASSIQGFVDTKALARHLRKYDNLFALMFGFMFREGGETLPTLKDLEPLLTRETFRVIPTPKGHRFEHRGGTVCSPIAWTGVGFASYMAGSILDMLRR